MSQKLILCSKKTEIVDINGNVLNVSGSDASNLQLSNAFSSIKNITASCFAIQKTILNELTPKPDWYDGLNRKFSNVKELAVTWLNDYAVAVTSTIPSSVITYAPLFGSYSDYIINIIGDKREELTPSEIQLISNVLEKMIDKVELISKDVYAYAHVNPNTKKSEGILIDWQKQMLDASSELASGNETVQKAISDLSDEVNALNDDVKALRADIAYYNKLVATGAGMVGGGAFLATVGGALCLGFPIVGGICLFLGIGSAIAGASVWGVYQKKINEANAKIRQNLSKINSDEKALTAISLLAGSCASVTEYAQIAAKNVSDFSTSWVTFGNTLKMTLAGLSSTEKSTKESALDTLLELNATKASWEKTTDYAEQLLSAPLEVKEVMADNITSVA